MAIWPPLTAIPPSAANSNWAPSNVDILFTDVLRLFTRIIDVFHCRFVYQKWALKGQILLRIFRFTSWFFSEAAIMMQTVDLSNLDSGSYRDQTVDSVWFLLKNTTPYNGFIPIFRVVYATKDSLPSLVRTLVTFEVRRAQWLWNFILKLVYC